MHGANADEMNLNEKGWIHERNTRADWILLSAGD